MLAHRIRFPRLRDLTSGSVLLAAWLSSCAPSGFQDEAQLQGGVRILASSADPPYAAPGQPVRVSVLAYDGRSQAAQSASPMHVYWFPIVCENPTLDEYYACFDQFAHPDAGPLGQVVSDDASSPSDAEAEPDDGGDSDGGDSAVTESGAMDSGASDATGIETSVADTGAADAGDAEASSDASTNAAADGSTDAAMAPGAPVVSTFSFVVPSDAVSSHPASPGATPYGLLVAFNFACAGQLTILPRGGNPQAPPLGCADATGQLLGPDSYVFGYTRVYAYSPDAGAAGTNTNPVVDCVDVQGATPRAGDNPGSDAGSSGGACAGMAPLEGTMPSWSVPTVTIPACAGDHTHCPHIKVGPHVTLASWEPVANGLHEEIWADYYSTFGSFTHDSTLLYDPTAGLIGTPSATDTEFDPPAAPASPDGYVWIVVHDNRGGAAWVTVPVHIGP